jgi:hypothetical protein
MQTKMNELRKQNLLKYWDNIKDPVKEQVFLALMSYNDEDRKFIEMQVQEFNILFTMNKDKTNEEAD